MPSVDEETRPEADQRREHDEELRLEQMRAAYIKMHEEARRREEAFAAVQAEQDAIVERANVRRLAFRRAAERRLLLKYMAAGVGAVVLAIGFTLFCVVPRLKL